MLSSGQYGVLHHDLVLNRYWAISVHAFVQEHPSMNILELRIELADESKRNQVYAYVDGVIRNIQNIATTKLIQKIQKRVRLQWYMECEEIEHFKDIVLCWHLYHEAPFFERIHAQMHVTQQELKDCMTWIGTQHPLESHCYEKV